jgi:hypothetical protein
MSAICFAVPWLTSEEMHFSSLRGDFAGVLQLGFAFSPGPLLLKFRGTAQFSGSSLKGKADFP